jgi:hypothetical protein
MTDELVPLEPITETAPEPLVISPELQAAIDAATTVIMGRSFSDRHPELGKMVNCRVCGLRHRQNERKCVQVFTYRVGEYELYREDEKGNVVPDYRTAMRPDEKPTRNQRGGAPVRVNFSKPRYNPHLSKIKLQFIERTRVVFQQIGFYLLDEKSEKFKKLDPAVQKLVLADFQEDLHRARVEAARQLRKEREFSDREYRRRRDQARRINLGFRVKVRA